ncbi:MAG: hypothetical protein LQ338_005684, partial [Usnochroma carphineum]
KENWPDHKSGCKAPAKDFSSGPTKGVLLPAYETVKVQQGDGIFNMAPAPITQRIGLPLIIRRKDHGVHASDNLHATWLMIDPANGLAPPSWQQTVGDCLVVRADKAPLDTETLAAVTDYVSDILDAFSDRVDQSIIAQRFYHREKLDRSIREHLQIQQDYKAFQENSQMFS